MLKRLAYNVHQIVNKLYSTIPLVPSGNLIQNIMQDIQYGLYDDCGDPDKNFDKWQSRCIELLKQRKLIGNNRKYKKVAYHDSNDRECAVLYINGEFYENETHNEALTDYTNANQIRRQNNPSSYKREVFEDEFYNNRNLEDSEYCCLNKVIYDPIFKQNVNRIFIDSETLKNISLNDLIGKIKSHYPNFEIYIENNSACAHDIDNYEKVGKNSRLKKLAKYYNYIEDGDNILFIYKDPSGREVDNMLSESNHNVIRGFLHSDGTTYSWDGDYLHEFVIKNIPEIKSNVHIEISSNKLTVFLDGINNADELNSYLSKLNLSIYGLTMSSQLIIDYNYYGSKSDEIYNSLNNSSNPTIGEFFDLLNGKVASLIKKSNNKINLKDILKPENIDSYGLNTDYGNRDFAIAYIEDKLYIGDTHKDIVYDYLNTNNEELTEHIDFSEGYVTGDEQDSIDLAMGFASYIHGIDGNDYIAVYPDSTYIIGVNEFCNYLKKEYPNAIICIDNNDRYMYNSDEMNVYIEKI